jgi:hypothetical protein
VARAARNIMDITVTLAGKDEACAKGVVAALVELLDVDFDDVVTSACGALMNITITTEGKKVALRDGLVAKLPGLLQSDDERVLLTAIKLITTTTEAPAARIELQVCCSDCPLCGRGVQRRS